MKRSFTTLKLSFFLCFLLAGIANATAQTLYWVNGSGSWSESSHWSLSSGGAGGAGVPTLNNDVTFDKKSFTQPGAVVTIDGAAYCNNLTWKGTEKFSPELQGGKGTSLAIGGSLLLQDKIDNSFEGSIVFTANGQQRIVAKTPIKSNLLFAGTANYSVAEQTIAIDKVKILNGSVTASGKLIEGSKPNSIQKASGKPKRAIDPVISTTGVKPKCNGGNDGSITVTITGGVPDFSYQLIRLTTPAYIIDPPYTSSERTFTFNNLNTPGVAKGSYLIVVTDVDGDVSVPISITEPSALSIKTISVKPVTCTGSNDGKITVEAQGGTAPYTYELRDKLGNLVGTPQNGTTGVAVTFNNVLPGTGYTVWVTDNNYPLATPPNQVGCGPKISTAVDVLESTALLSLSFNPTDIVDVQCYGTNTGQAKVTAADGTGPYTFSLSPAAGILNVAGSTATFSNLPKNNYTAQVTDAYGCVKTVAFTINEPAELKGKIDAQTNLDCKGAVPPTGSVTVSAIGGISPFTYTISAPGTPSSVGPTVGVATFAPLAAGSYIVNITDKNGCTTNTTTDVNVTITEPATAVTITSQTKTDITCNTSGNGVVTIAASGGTGALTFYLYKRPNTATPFATQTNNGEFKGLQAATYYVEVVDTKGCKQTSSDLTIAEPSSVNYTEDHDNINCYGANTGVIRLHGNGGTPFVVAGKKNYEYNFNGQGFKVDSVFTGLSAGIAYTVVVRDKNGCTSIPSTITLTQNAKITGTVSGTTHLKCKGVNNGSFKVNVSGGTAPFTFTATIGATTVNGDAAGNFSGLAPGIYNVTITDSKGCTNPDPISVTINDATTAVLTATISSTPVTCAGIVPPTGTVTVTASGGLANYTYTISGPAPLPAPPTFTGAGPANFTNLSSGTFTVTVVDANGCSVTPAPSVAVSESATPVAVSLTSTKAPKCNAGPSVATGEATLTASGGTGIYYFKKSSDPTYPGTPSANPFTFTGLTSGSHTFWVKDSYGCEKSIVVNIVPDADMSVVSLTSTPVTCKGQGNGTVALKITGGNPPYKTYTLNQTGAVGTEDPVTHVVTFTNLAAGNYSITVVDNNDCSFITPIVDVKEAATALNPTYTKEDVKCKGGSTGSIIINPIGGEAPYQYKNGAAGTYGPAATFSGLPKGDYDIYVKDSYGCEVIVKVSIAEPEVISIESSSATAVKCFDEFTGAITVKAKGGTANYSYTLTGGPAPGVNVSMPNEPGEVTFSGLHAGSYTVSVTDKNSCTPAILNIDVTQPAAALTATVTTINNVSCNGGSDGSAKVTPSGGTKPYTYTIDIPGNTPAIDPVTGAATFSGINAASHTVTITDANGAGCTITAVIDLTEPAAITFTEKVTNVTGCYGNANGEIEITGTAGGTGPYNYLLTPGNISNTTGKFTGLKALDAGGTPIIYKVTVTDNKGCTKVSSNITLTQPTEVTFTTTIEQPNCTTNGGKGKITIVASGGTGPYMYSRTKGITWQADPNNFFKDLNPGTYYIRVKDSKNCETKDVKVDIVGITPISLVSGDWKDVTGCNGDATGSITVVVTGGTPPYQYSRDGGTTWQPTGFFDKLYAGTYTITVKDAAGCTAIIGPHTIGQPPVIKITPIATQDVTICWYNTNGAIILDANGGTPPLKYYIDGKTNPDGFFDGLGTTPKPHVIRIEDANGCTKDTSITIAGPPEIVIDPTTVVTNPSCNGMATPDGSANIVATGGTGALTYSLNGGAPQPTGLFSGLNAGNYTVTITDANSCTLTYDFTLTEPLAITIDSETFSNVSCNGANDGKITVAASGGTTPLTYNLLVGGVVNKTTTDGKFTNLPANTYTVNVVDSKGCSKDGSTFKIEEPIAITVTSSSENIKCAGDKNGKITVTATGGSGTYTYNLLKGAAIVATNTVGAFTDVAPGTYTVTVTDANGCTPTPAAVGPFTITEPTPLTYTLTTTNLTCGGSATPDGKIVVNVTGGGTAPYTFNCTLAGAPITLSVVGNTATASNLAAGDYSFTITDAIGCDSTFTTTITQPLPLTIDATGTNPSCNSMSPWDGKITATSTGGTFSGVDPKLYQAVRTSPTPWTSTWSTTPTFTALEPGDYTITVRDKNGCTATDNVTLAAPLPITLDTPVSVNPTCTALGSITVVAHGGTPDYKFTLNPGGATITNATQAVFSGLGANTYTVSVTDKNNCAATVTAPIPLTAPSTLKIDDVKITNITTCFGETTGKLEILVSGQVGTVHYSIDNGTTWVDNINIFDSKPAGIYMVKVDDDNNCPTGIQVEITQPKQLVVVVNSQKNPTAGNSNGEIHVTSTGGTGVVTYTISPAIGTQPTPGDFLDLPAGSYTIEATDEKGCKATITIDLSDFTANITATNVTCKGRNDGTITLTVVGSTDYTVTWTKDGAAYTTEMNAKLDAGVYKNLEPGIYEATVKDNGSPRQKVVTATIANPTKISYTLTKTDLNCGGISTGSITIQNTSGGTAPYSYTINGGAITPVVSPDTKSASASNLAAGDYTIVITDAVGCDSTFTVTIAQPAPLTIDATGRDPLCSSAPWTGRITATSTGGTFSAANPKLYQVVRTSPTPWTSTWSTTPIFNNLEAGDYIITVRDKNGCTATDNVTLTAPLPITIDAPVSVNPTCTALGSITVVAHGGTPDYKFTLNPGGATITNATQAVFSGLGANTYTVTVTDKNSCAAAVTAPITLTSPSTLKIDDVKTTPVTPCFGGTNGKLEILVSGQVGTVHYSIDNGKTWVDDVNIFDKLPAGNYLIKVNDDSDCPTGIQVAITQPEQLVIVVDPLLQIEPTPGATDGQIHVTATGGTPPVVFTISPAVGTQPTLGDFLDLPAGTYTISATDANGCNAIPVVISLSDFTVTIDSTQITCNGANDGTITLNVNGTLNFTVAWTKDGVAYDTEMNAKYDGNGYKNLEPGVYKAIITDLTTGRIIEKTATITQPPAIAITAVEVAPKDMCAGKNQGMITVKMDDPTAYLYSIYGDDDAKYTANNIFTSLPTGSYEVWVKAVATGCKVSWKDNPIVLPNYSDVPDPIVLTQDPGAVLTVVCPDDLTAHVTYTATGGVPPYKFIWTEHTEDIDHTPVEIIHPSGSNLGKGHYEVTVIDNHNCRSTSEFFDVTGPDDWYLNPMITHAVCRQLGEIPGKPLPPKANRGAITINPTGATPSYTYKWERWSLDPLLPDFTTPEYWKDNSAYDLEPSDAFFTDIFYTVTVTDAIGCKHSDWYTIGYDNHLNPIIETNKTLTKPTEWDHDTACYKGTLKMWSSKKRSIFTDYEKVDHWQSVPDIFGYPYPNTDTIIPTFKDTTIVKLVVSKTVKIGTTEGICYDWDTLKVHLYPRLGVNVIKDEKFESENTIVLPVNVSYNLTSTITSNNTHPIKYWWGNDGTTLFNPTNGNQTTINIPTSYPLVFNETDRRYYTTIYAIAQDTVTKCIDTSAVKIKVLKNINIPNAFSPNGDGINDTWAIWDLAGLPINFLFPNIEVEVFNRWGSRVFYSKGYNKPWDGKAKNGGDMPVGTYYYVITFNRDGYSNEVGSVTILR